MPRTIVTLDVATGSYTNIADDVSVSGINVGISGSLTVTGSAYFKNTQVDSGPITSTGISGSLTRLADGTSYLLAGSNVQITSSSNGPITISSSVSSSAGGPSVVSYNGYTSGSVQWNSTTWADFHTVPSNFVDRIQNGITRNNSTFTVVSGGIYFFHSDFLHGNGYSFTGWRLSGSNGTIIQQTTFTWTPYQEGDSSDLAGAFALSANESFKLQYIRKDGYGAAGSSNLANPQNPIGGENMRFGVITIFRLGDA